MSTENDVEYISLGEEDELEFHGYQDSKCRAIISWIGVILSGGLLRLFFHWFPRYHLYSRHAPCQLSTATKVHVVETFQKTLKNHYVEEIKTIIFPSLKSESEEKESPKKYERKIKFYLSNGTGKVVESIRYFNCKKSIYVWDEDSKKFFALSGLENALKNRDFHRIEGLTVEEQSIRQIAYGHNEIPIPVQSISTLFLLEVLNPFYVFQAFSLSVWFSDNYYYYGTAIGMMSLFGAMTSVIQTRRNQEQLRRTVTSSNVVTVIRRVEGKEQGNGVKEEILAKYLVPGDIIALPPHGCVMSCDAVLLSGNATVNESMLTGESIPVRKVPIAKDERRFDEKDDNVKHSILFSGTKVLQTRNSGDHWPKAVVIRTGFLTSKGQIVKTILYPPPVDFPFEKDSYKFVALLAVIAFGGIVYTVITKALRGIAIGDIIIKAIDLLTITIPPSLPAAVSIGKMQAQRRLKEKGIFCINTRMINMSGSIDCVCYDKTGTLTEDDMDMWAVIPVKNRELQTTIRDFPIYRENLNDANKPKQQENFVIAMATCHSLTYLGNQIIGDPLDLKMFESTGWVLEEPKSSETSQLNLLAPTVVRPSGKEVSEQGQTIIRQFHFSSSLQRMSVITKKLGNGSLSVYCKGSPEMVMSLSKPESIPESISSTMKTYTRKGYRVLALAWRPITPEINLAQIQVMKRELAEKDLHFLGLILFENRLKNGSELIIRNLNEATIKQIMITGDNILTAVSVAQKCGLVSCEQKIYQILSPKEQINNSKEIKNYNWTAKNIFNHHDVIELKLPLKEDHAHVSSNYSIGVLQKDGDLEKGIYNFKTTYALSGAVWDELRKNNVELLKIVVESGTIYARMSPAQKQQLVQQLQAAGYYVAMCGDGANDYGALKAAHVGISLSEAEYSAVSPFTSNGRDISCVPQVMAEGRAALVTSFGLFKFMATASLVQFSAVIVLYSIESNLTDFEFMYIDICLVALFAALFGLTGPPSSEKNLSAIPPSAKLFSIYPIASLISQVFIMAIFQLVAFYGVQQFPWFVPFNYKDSILNTGYAFSSYENYSVFSIASFQYIWMVIVFSRGAPHRQRLLSNKKLLISLVSMALLSLIIGISPFMAYHLPLAIPPPFGDRLFIIPLAALNFLISLSIEWGFIENILERGKGKKLWKKRKDQSISEFKRGKWFKSLMPNPTKKFPVTTENNLVPTKTLVT